MPTNAMRGIAVLFLAAILAGSFAAAVGAVTNPPPPNALEILWADYCTRTADAACAAPTPTPSPVPTTTPTATPVATPAPTPTAAPTSTPTSTPTPAPTATGTPTPTPTTAPPLPSGVNVGQHIHVEVTNHPVSGFPIPQGPYTFHVVVKEHDNAGALTYLRIDRDGGTTTDKRALSLGPCADCSLAFDWTINFAGWSVGRHEIRWHAEEPDTGAPNNHQRQFTTSRVQICVVACSPSYRSGDWHGGGSWYGDYAVARVQSPDTAFRSGGTFNQSSQYGSHVCSYLNANFHAGSHGTPLGCGSTATIPASAQPGDKVAVIADDTQQAGVFVFFVGDGSPHATADYEFQSWWAQGGLNIP